MLRLDVLPARYGDCLWIDYGEGLDTHRILIDGGAPGTYRRSLRPRLRQLGGSGHLFELLIVTHVDYDHIRGVIELAHDDEISFAAKDIWFNGWRHLSKAQNVLAGKHGEQLTDLIRKNGRAWNRKFQGEAVATPDEGPLPVIEIPGGMKIRLLAPTRTLKQEPEHDPLTATRTQLCRYWAWWTKDEDFFRRLPMICRSLPEGSLRRSPDELKIRRDHG